MTSDANTILREALLLGEHDRAGIAAELLASLDSETESDEATITQAWANETIRRAERVLAGDEATTEWAIVRDRVVADLKR